MTTRLLSEEPTITQDSTPPDELIAAGTGNKQPKKTQQSNNSEKRTVAARRMFSKKFADSIPKLDDLGGPQIVNKVPKGRQNAYKNKRHK